jgi:putative transposase
LGEVRHLIVDARYEKSHFGGVVRDVAVLSAIGIGSDERRRVLDIQQRTSQHGHRRHNANTKLAMGMPMAA